MKRLFRWFRLRGTETWVFDGQWRKVRGHLLLTNVRPPLGKGW